VFQVIYDLKKFETEKGSVTQCSIDNNFGMKRKTLDYILHETHYNIQCTMIRMRKCMHYINARGKKHNISHI
jgi:hypothetical protein